MIKGVMDTKIRRELDERCTEDIHIVKYHHDQLVQEMKRKLLSANLGTSSGNWNGSSLNMWFSLARHSRFIRRLEVDF